MDNTHHWFAISIQASLSEVVLSTKVKFWSRLSIDDQLKKELERATEYPWKCVWHMAAYPALMIPKLGRNFEGN